jgi:hypothetical protein
LADKRYYVVEARLPVQIADALSVEEAARKAARVIERDYNVNISNWFLRVFVYGESEGELGPIEEWFANPTGTRFRQREQNIDFHFEMIKNNQTPDDLKEE